MGPVVFVDAVAVELFSTLLVPALSSTPPVEQDPSVWSWEAPDKKGGMRLKRQVLPEGYSVVDDPLAMPSLSSSYHYGDEGVPAERVTLVEDGLIRGLLASRTPGPDAPKSNGHGRGDAGSLIRATPSTFTVTPTHPRSERALLKEALKRAKSYDLDYVLVVRRFGNTDAGQPATAFGPPAPSPGLRAPLDIVRVYADGHDEPVRGLVFDDVDVRVLKDIVAAGTATTRTVEYRSGSGEGGMSVPATFTVPGVLISEMQLSPEVAPDREPPPVPSPLGAPEGG